ncbi:MAG: hypothetical protein WD229_04385 [Pirellulales bacterium]
MDLLRLLGQLFDQIFVPPTVLRELEQPPSRFAPVLISQFNFIEVRAPQDTAQVQQFLQLLDSGESEALALALEIGAEAVLIDELIGRSVAVDHGLPVIGTWGFFRAQKRRGIS